MVDEVAKEDLKNEIATTRDGKDITRGYVNGLPLLLPTDTVLQLKGVGDYRVYMEVMRDDEVKASFGQRVRAVISRPWEVTPGGNKLIDKNAAKFVNKVIDNLKFDDLTEKMLYGVFYGYSVSELIWAEQDNQWVVTDIKVRDRRRFGFNPDMELRMKTMQNIMGEALPPYKFWSFNCGADHDDEPYGIGLAHWLYWPVFFKRNGIRFWLTFLEKFGTPTAKGTYPAGTPETDQDALLNALRDIQNDSAFIVPEGMTAELLEASRSGTADYKGLVDIMNNAINKVIVGQTASSQGTPGRLGNDDLQGDVRLDIVKADADLISMSLNATVVKWLVDFNFAGAAYPQVWRIVEEPEDLVARSERDKNVKDLGFKPKLEYVTKTYGDDWEEVTSPDEGELGVTSGNPAEFAEGETTQDQQALDDAIELLATNNMQDNMDKLLKPIVKLVNEKSPEQVRETLAESFAELDEVGMQELMARAFFVAEVWGRLNVDVD